VEDLHDPASFEFTFPLWTLIHPTLKTRGLIEMPVPGGKAAPLFTDNDLADRYLREHPELGHYVLGSFASPAKLLPFLDLLEKRGFTHVLTDPSRGRGLPFRIAELRSVARGQPDQDSGAPPG
jgi:hypothetical protein